MTQGSKMSIVNPTVPAAIVATAETPTIRAAWNELRNNARPLDFAVYALARQLHAARVYHNDNVEPTQEEIDERCLRKLVRTFSPIRNRNKLTNGCKPFDALYAALGQCKVGWAEKTTLGMILDEQELKAIRTSADRLFTECRRRGNDELLKLAAQPPAPRAKRPFAREG